MTDNELLLAISNMLDVKLKAELEPIKTDIKAMKENISGIKLDIENVIEPSLSCMYRQPNNHSEKLQKIS